ncbi:glycosyltransferase family 2 protein [Nocardioides sp.]|uniref:glycosyltransferase family 2 protein n=1 Tax=Nocardioides sp. TaxID=35761 RepID=UPI002ED30813
MPLLSVVVPAYQVVEWLEESLRSVLDQSLRDLEVVVVDDGSTDGTGELADRIAAADPRVRVLHQPNAGLGAARNAGTAASTGELLTFADSDDLVLPGAYERLVGSLQASGSDLAIGAVERLRGTETSMTPLMRVNHRAPLVGARIDDAPLLLADVFAWNKVFRRAFWDEHGLQFPGGRTRYEDQPTITEALVRARIDSLVEPVYHWRVRDDGSSISQQRGDIRDLADRLRTKSWSLDTVRDHTRPPTARLFVRRVLPIDMWEYFRSVPGCTDDYFDLLRHGVNELWLPDGVPFEQTALPLRQRIMGWLVGRGMRRELEEFLVWLDAQPSPLPTREVGGRMVVDHPFADHPDLPDELRTP